MKKNLLEKYCENTHTLTRNSWQTHTALAKARKYVYLYIFSSTQKKSQIDTSILSSLAKYLKREHIKININVLFLKCE